jgi:hypothetical protein
MSQTLINIPKSSFCIFLATDDGKLIIDDDDNLYLVIKGFDTLSGLDKNTGVITNISKNQSYLPFFRLLEGTVNSFRLQEDGDEKRLLENKITNSNIKKS